MRQTHQAYIDGLYEKFGGAARFIELNVSPVDQGPQEYDEELLEWHGHPEVVGTNGDFAGVLIDEETITLLDTSQQKIIDTDDKVYVAFAYCLRRERDEKKQDEIMTLYQRLVNELLKQYTRAAG